MTLVIKSLDLFELICDYPYYKNVLFYIEVISKFGMKRFSFS